MKVRNLTKIQPKGVSNRNVYLTGMQKVLNREKIPKFLRQEE